MYQRILVPIDGSPTSTQGLDEAIRLAKVTGGRIRLLHVLDELVFPTGFGTGASYLEDVMPRKRLEGQRILDKGRDHVQAAGVAVDTFESECFATRTSDVVCAEATAWNADLIVIGTHGRRGVGRVLLGSDAEQVVRSASIPVLLVRAADESAVPRVPSAGEASDSATARNATRPT
ncbi:MAG: universal stress protein [Caldimonas sp.]